MSAAAYISEACRLYVLIALLFSALGKSFAIHQFRQTLAASFHVPEAASRPAAFLIVGVEWLVIALLGAGGLWSSYGLAAFLAMIAIFSAALGEALFRGAPVYCNCFGPSSEELSVYDLLRNALLAAAAGFALFHIPAEAVPGTAATILLGGVAVIAFLVSTNLRRIVHLAAKG